MNVNIPIELLINTSLTAIIGWIVKVMLDNVKAYREESKQWRKALDDKVDNINNATQATMRTTILHYCEKYLTRGWITSEELSSLTDMHKKYTMLNDQNGFIDTYFNRVQQLDTKEI